LSMVAWADGLVFMVTLLKINPKGGKYDKD
jgi:hypothetical protein